MRLVCGALLLLTALGASAGEPPAARDQVRVAGNEGVPVPTKLKHVEPVHPAEALERGLRGIVILDLVIDGRGQVVSAQVVRSVPGLDEAAIAAARQWRYEPVQVGGQPVSVSLTVPVTFALELPKLDREAGIPELRQGAAPRYPQTANGNASASAEVTLAADGRVDTTQLRAGSEPWAGALLAALKTWRFTEAADESVVSFRVEASFLATKASGAGSVKLRASGLRRTDLLSAAQPPAEPPPAAEPPTTDAKPAERPGAPTAGTPPDPPAAAAAQAPAVEVLTAPPPSPPPEGGVSAVRDVTLGAGVPELSRGRRPVVPPLARINGITGSVEVSFSVGSAGTTLLRGVSGPEGLQKAAQEAVASWVFRRTRADRIYLVASFGYAADGATAVVKLQPAPDQPVGAPPAAPPGVPEPPPTASPVSPPPPPQP